MGPLRSTGGTHRYANSSSSNYGVNNDGSGTLSGYAWGTSVGWINFDPTDGGVTIDLASGRLSGYAWGENMGWIRFSNTTLGADSYQVVAKLDDGPENSIEDAVPNPTGGGNGDGNGDNTPDRDQENVVSLPNSTTGDYVTFEVDEAYSFVWLRAVNNPAANSSPANADFKQGFFNFNVIGLNPGASFQVTMILRGATQPISYWKYGPTPDSNNDHWYEFAYDGTTGAVINGNTIVLHFKDGARGDSDLLENGQISDPGAPGYQVASTPAPPPAPSNQPPQLDTPLPNISVTEGATDQYINLLRYFSDPESDLLTFTVVGNSNREVLPSVLVGQTLSDFLMLDFGTPGQTEITIEAKEDIHHKTYQGSFIVTVLEATAPTATATAMPTQTAEPTAMSTQAPSATAMPTQAPEPTATIEPSATAMPTQTPAPSATTMPTQTPEPTATVVSTPIVDVNAIQLFLPMVSR